MAGKEMPGARRVRHERVKLKAALAEKLLDETMREEVVERFGLAALHKRYEPKVTWRASNRTPHSPGTPMLMISDWHHGEKVDPEQVFNSNAFDMDISKRRLKRVFETSVTLLQKHMAHPQFPGIVLVLGGDIVNGNLHEESGYGNEAPPLVQALDASKALADGVKFLSENFPEVSVYGVPGNHGRITRKPWAKFYAHQNLDWLAYQMTRDHTAHLPNVTWNVPPVRDMTFMVEGRRFRLTHGDQFRGGDGVIGALGPVIRGDVKKRVSASMMPGTPEAYDTMLAGHFHQLVMMPRVIINGSIKGYDEFALSIGAPWEPPQQALWTVHSKFGLNWHMPVIADEAFTASAIERKAA